MKDVFAIGFSLSKSWTYREKKDAIDHASSFEQFFQNKSLSKEPTLAIDTKTAEQQIKKLHDKNGWLWIYGEADYPKILNLMPNPPLVIYGLGKKDVDWGNTLGFIGTREPTPYGRRTAGRLAKELVLEGLTLVSGLARGIDSIGHQAAIQATAPTVGVLAHGLDQTYPPEHKKMKEQIIDTGGTLISEFPFGIKARKEFFPQRNRIISGLCKGILVIEAGERSGTRLTVNHALEQSREVFAVPGPIDSDLSMFTNEIISQGATMVRSSQDVLSSYPHRTNQKSTEKPITIQFTKLQEKILKFLSPNDPKSMGEFLATYPTDVKEVMQSLTELEIHGQIIKQPDATYVRAEVHE